MDFTSKGLKKPTDLEAQDVVDLNFNADRINNFGMGLPVYTSTTRPSGADRWPGLEILESDTNLTRIWTGAEWMLTSGSRDHTPSAGSNLYNPAYALSIAGTLGAVTAIAGADITMAVPGGMTARWDFSAPAATIPATSELNVVVNRQVNGGAATKENGWTFANPTAGQFTVPVYLYHQYRNTGPTTAQVRVWLDGYKNNGTGAISAKDGMPVTFYASLSI